jgi:hypothetical protein
LTHDLNDPINCDGVSIFLVLILKSGISNDRRESDPGGAFPYNMLGRLFAAGQSGGATSPRRD